MSFFNKFFSDNKTPPLNPIVPTVDKLVTEIGLAWAQISATKTYPNEDLKTARSLMPAHGDYGQREDNIHALMNRFQDKKRFLIHNKQHFWRLDLWYGTLVTGGPPDLQDGDGVDFFRKDSKASLTILISIPKSDAASAGANSVSIHEGGIGLLLDAKHTKDPSLSNDDLILKLKDIRYKITTISHSFKLE